VSPWSSDRLKLFLYGLHHCYAPRSIATASFTHREWMMVLYITIYNSFEHNLIEYCACCRMIGKLTSTACLWSGLSSDLSDTYGRLLLCLWFRGCQLTKNSYNFQEATSPRSRFCELILAKCLLRRIIA